MRKRNRLIVMLIAIMVCCCGTVSWAGGSAKVKVCHIPPGDPSNFHTITVSENALPAHLAHGDIPGGCLDSCEILCDDGDACTVDACDPATEQCAPDHPPVDCDDLLYCTTDNCDPAVGCVYAPVTCTPPDLCFVSTCSEVDQGACVDTPVACGDGEICDPATGLCTDPCSGVVCEPTEQCVVGTCIGGECFFDPAAEGTPCDDGNPATWNDRCQSGACIGDWPPQGTTEIDAVCNEFICEVIDTDQTEADIILEGSSVIHLETDFWVETVAVTLDYHPDPSFDMTDLCRVEVYPSTTGFSVDVFFDTMRLPIGPNTLALYTVEVYPVPPPPAGAKTSDSILILTNGPGTG